MEASDEDSSQLRSFERRVAVLAELLATVVVLVQCSAAAPPHAGTPSPSVTPSSSAAAASSASAPPAPAAVTVQPVSAAELGTTWRPGCPVEPEQLRRVDVDYLGFDGQTHRGELIVHEDLVPEVISIFEQLHRLGYPVEKIRTVDHYSDADDELSMEDNNTSAFNCRRIPGTDDWSPHAYGRAIDINPLINPCLYASGYFEPRERGGLPGPQPHRPGAHPRWRPGRARLHRSWLALGWLLDDSRLPTLRAALSSTALKTQGPGRRRRNLTSQIRHRWTASRVDRVREQNYVGI